MVAPSTARNAVLLVYCLCTICGYIAGSVCPCYNGQCQNGTTCDCGSEGYFLQGDCKIINMSAPSVIPSSRTVVFNWPLKIEFKSDYNFVYKEDSTSNSNSTWKIQRVFRWMSNRRLLMVYLNPKTQYTICIVHKNTSSNIQLYHNKTKDDDDCISTTTTELHRTFDYIFYAAVAYVCAVPVILVVVKIIMSRKALQVKPVMKEVETELEMRAMVPEEDKGQQQVKTPGQVSSF